MTRVSVKLGVLVLMGVGSFAGCRQAGWPTAYPTVPPSLPPPQVPGATVPQVAPQVPSWPGGTYSPGGAVQPNGTLPPATNAPLSGPPVAAPLEAPSQGVSAVPSPGLLTPSWTNPGTLSQQQQRAIIHDPYATDTAGPDIAGVRPREYQKPLPEPVRARGFRDVRWPF